MIHTPPFGAGNYGNPDVWEHDPGDWGVGRIRAGEPPHEPATNSK